MSICGAETMTLFAAWRCAQNSLAPAMTPLIFPVRILAAELPPSLTRLTTRLEAWYTLFMMLPDDLIARQTQVHMSGGATPLVPAKAEER
jgi:hypothetical protein